MAHKGVKKLKKKERPVVLLLYRYWPKSPASMDLYEKYTIESQLGHTKCEVVRDIDSEAGIDLEKYTEQMLGGRPPDYLFIGLGSLQSTLRSPQNGKFIVREGIQPVMMIGDSTQFMGQAWGTVNSNIDWSILINPNSISPEVPPMADMARWIQTHRSQQQAKLYGVPWGVDPVKYRDRGLDRDIDVLFMMTVTTTWELHQARIPMLRTVQQMANNKEISLTSGNINPQNGLWMGIHGDIYNEALQAHKMIICETGMRKVMTAKYVEAAHAGCLIVGDKPGGEDELFEDGVTFAEVDMKNLVPSLREKIIYYKNHKKEREAVVEEMKRRIQGYTTDSMLEQIDDILFNNHKPKDTKRWRCLVCGKDDLPYKGGMWFDKEKKNGRICEECRQKWIKRTFPLL